MNLLNIEILKKVSNLQIDVATLPNVVASILNNNLKEDQIEKTNIFLVKTIENIKNDASFLESNLKNINIDI